MHPSIVHNHQAHPEEAFFGKIVEKHKYLNILIVIGTGLKVEWVRKIIKIFSNCPRYLTK